jgi:hypothetical protein
MPVWLVTTIRVDDDRETIESWRVNAPTQAEAVREVAALSSIKGHRIEAKLLGEEEAGTLVPGQATRVD